MFNLQEGENEMEEEEDEERRRRDDDARSQIASHSRQVIQTVAVISKPNRSANIDRSRQQRDQVDKIVRMGKSTILESLMSFCSAIESIYTKEYIRRPMTIDLQRLLKKGEMRVFPGMIGSINCMHWTWKNCPSTWQRAYGD
ncbi:uncharacterized protein [Pyrus communis]|uniref:uncharacterized protein n=1 Tax=Pyrus communis TaxID=23211 RepID=UPI0035BF0959